MCILAVFVVAYGVARHVILNPNEQMFTEKTFRSLTLIPFFHLFGELFLDYPQDSVSYFDFPCPG